MGEHIQSEIGKLDQKKLTRRDFIRWGTAVGLGVGLLSSGCNGKEGVHPSQIPTFGETPAITETYTPPTQEVTPEISVTPETAEVFRAGPESMVEGQENQLHWEHGWQDMDKLLPVLKEYMEEKGIKPTDVTSVNPNGGLFAAEYYPYAMVREDFPTKSILAYSILTMPDGSKLRVMHLPVRSGNSEDILILNVALEDAPSYWQKRIDRGLTTQKQYELNFEPAGQFQLLAEEPDTNSYLEANICINLQEPSGSDYLPDFPETKIILDNNAQIDGRLNEYFFAPFSDKKALQWNIEHQIMPAVILHSSTWRE